MDDRLVSVRPVLDRIERFAGEGTGRPLRNADFIADLERRLEEQKQNKMLDGDSTAVSVALCGIGLQLRAVFDIVDRKE